MRLSVRQVELLRTTYALLEPKGRVAALAYFQRLFALNPRLRNTPGFDLDTEAGKLLVVWRTAIEFADEPRRLKPWLGASGRQCASYTARGELGRESEDALLWSLATTLGGDFTPEARIAWADLHAMVGELSSEVSPPAAPGSPRGACHKDATQVG